MRPVLVTLDIDWAPDHVIDDVAGRLVAAGVSATFFVTHASPAVDRLAARPELFELGIHPNFLPGSTHGTDPAAVLAHCMALVPQARAMRTHGLFQATHILDLVLAKTPIEIDSSILLHRARHAPVAVHRCGARRLLRVPFVFEDDIEVREPVPDWTVEGVATDGGPCVVNFHPVRIVLNTASDGPYRALTSRYRDLTAAPVTAFAELASDGPGPGTLFDALVRTLSESGQAMRLSEWVLRSGAGAGP